MAWELQIDENGNRKPVFVEDEKTVVETEVAPEPTTRNIFVHLDENNAVIGWATSKGHEDEIEIEIDKDDPFLSDNPFNYSYNEGSLIKSDLLVLSKAKEEKDRELNKACERSILAGFKHTIDGVEYHFSYDMQAQQNFGDSRALLNDGVIPAVPWTVRVNGKYQRITVDKPEMDKITLSVLQHKTNNISKYRDTLLPMVENAQTLEEVNSISWDSI